MCKPTDTSSSASSTTSPQLSAVGFLGAGMMATAIMDGLLDQKVVALPSAIACSDVFEGAVQRAQQKGYIASADNAVVCEHVAKHDTNTALMIAVKPHIVVDVCHDIMAAAPDSHALIISVAAGVTLATLQQHLPGRRVVRVMPNTPCAVGASATGYSMGDLCTAQDQATVQAIFGSVGIALQVPREALLNGVTGVSGSGPAYVFQFIEALADGGVRVGLPRDTALRLAAQTVQGAAAMVLATGEHPGVLKDRVCSPGGTTIAGMEQLEQGQLRATVMNAVKASTRRSLQLGGVAEQDIVQEYNL